MTKNSKMLTPIKLNYKVQWYGIQNNNVKYGKTFQYNKRSVVYFAAWYFTTNKVYIHCISTHSKQHSRDFDVYPQSPIVIHAQYPQHLAWAFATIYTVSYKHSPQNQEYLARILKPTSNTYFIPILWDNIRYIVIAYSFKIISAIYCITIQRQFYR